MSPAALAQYDPYANDIPTTPDQQDAIDAASDFLTVIGGEDLNGVSISNAALTPGTLGAVTEDGSSIGVDFEALDGLLPPGAGPDSGAVMITIFHELQHLKGWGRDPCSHKKLIVYVASKHCEYIAWLIATGGSTTNACYLYSKIRDSINGAPPPPNCPDDPGPISGCAGCPI